MIGKLLIPASEGKTLEAILTDDGNWECEDEILLRFLTVEFPLAGSYASPAAGQWGALLLHDAGVALGAKVEIEPREPPDPNKVY